MQALRSPITHLSSQPWVYLKVDSIFSEPSSSSTTVLATNIVSEWLTTILAAIGGVIVKSRLTHHTNLLYFSVSVSECWLGDRYLKRKKKKRGGRKYVYVMHTIWCVNISDHCSVLIVHPNDAPLISVKQVYVL